MSANKPAAMRVSLVCSAILATLTTVPVSAIAEESAENTTSIEKVTVTARRKTETLVEIPMAISSVSAMEIADRNYTSATDLYRTLAGAAMPRGQLILRGLSGGNSTTPDTTTTFVDDVPYDFTNLSDVERVEVLRGPQGTLYGSNAIGGTVRIITKKPVLDEFELFGSVQAGSEKDVDGYDSNISLGINMPLIDGKLALRVNGNLGHDQRPLVNVNTGLQSDADSGFVRSQLLWKATDDLNVIFGFARVEFDSRGNTLGDTSQPGYYYDYSLSENPDAAYGYDVDVFEVECPDGASRPQCRLGTAPRAKGGVPERYQIWERLDPWYKETDNLFTLNIQDENFFNFATLTYAGSFRKNKTDGLDNWTRLDGDDLFLTWIINDDYYEETTHELRLQNLDANSPLSWTVGMFYDKTETKDNPNTQNQYHEGGDKAWAIMNYWYEVDWAAMGEQYFGNNQHNWNSATQLDYAREFAMFADVAYTFDLGDMGELELNGGIRRFDLKDEFIATERGIWTNWDEPWEDVETNTDGEESGNRYKFSASWRPSNDFSVYALYSEGYRPGGNNGPLPGSCIDDPQAPNRKNRYTSDSIDNYELGIKASVLDNRFDFAAAVYQIDWTGIKTDVYMDTCGFSYTANAGEARSRGFEFESTARLTDDLTMTFNTSYTNSELLEDNDSIGGKKGDKMTMVPDWNGYLALDQGFQMFGKQAYIRGDWTYYGEYKTHFNVRPEDVVPSYSYFNLSGRYEVSDNIKLSVHINNVFDKEAEKYKRARSRSINNTVAQEYIEFLEGRSITVRLDYTFF
ncbi:TonB-dependent receptor [Shewanella sedimentimangrovi]|uniref:TonB-dependent receptor n=1 Tax=Shewanella sedimentimangrovi TaxID=2814293 RepID=A0ABX7QZJ7_9GAMM|nr:TonB-dependent receptor [Shewanella sedimentimangrovi]QSX36341.1 TonB-dependent receptor [Shewanella sedimentimangrovi]